MLMQLLPLVEESGVHSCATLTNQLSVNICLLAQMGYVAPVGRACDTSQCHHYPLCDSGDQRYRWFFGRDSGALGEDRGYCVDVTIAQSEGKLPRNSFFCNFLQSEICKNYSNE